MKKQNKQNNSLVTLIGFHKYVQDRVISKESVENSSDILDANVDHKYQNHSNRVIASALSEHFQHEWLWMTVCKWVSPQHTIVLPISAPWKHAQFLGNSIYIKCPEVAYTHWKTYNYMIKLTFYCSFWVYSFNMTLFRWFWWYLWPEMASKMSQEFPTASLDVTARKHF